MVESWRRSRSSKRGKTTLTRMQQRKTKDNAHPRDRPKWRRAGARACQKCRDSTGRENQSTRIEALSRLTELLKYCRLWKCRVRLSRASRYCFSYLAWELLIKPLRELLALCSPAREHSKQEIEAKATKAVCR